MEEGEADKEEGEMKKVSVWMHSCLLYTDSCTQGHTHKHEQMRACAHTHTHTLASITLASLALLLAAFALGPFLIVEYSRALLSQLSHIWVLNLSC